MAKAAVDWSSVDWSMSDRALGALLQVSRGTVQRRRPGAREPSAAHGGRRHGVEPEGAAEAILLRLGAERLTWLRETAEAREVSAAQVVRDLVDDARQRG